MGVWERNRMYIKTGLLVVQQGSAAGQPRKKNLEASRIFVRKKNRLLIVCVTIEQNRGENPQLDELNNSCNIMLI